MLYPIKFKPIYKEKVWGGNKLSKILEKRDIHSQKTGESWEISCVGNDLSVVDNGFLKGKNIKELIGEYKYSITGMKIYENFGDEFPLLIKFIDATDDLSVQVHPDDETARRNHNCSGKTEMWYIMQADAGAQLISGVKRDTEKTEFKNLTEKKKLADILNFVSVKKGDVFYIPSGHIHAIGKGVLLAEIQQNSDITYRIYDWDRPDDSGNMRELHTEQALEVAILSAETNFIAPPEKINDFKTNIALSKYFTVNKIEFSGEIKQDYSSIDSFVVLVCTEGNFSIRYNEKEEISVCKGETILIPAVLNFLIFDADSLCEILEIYI